MPDLEKISKLLYNTFITNDSAIAVQTEEQASELEKYFKSHSGREWVIKHLGLPIGMKSLS